MQQFLIFQPVVGLLFFVCEMLDCSNNIHQVGPVYSSSLTLMIPLCAFFYLFSFDYEDAGYKAADLIRMDILLNGRSVEELVTIVHR